MSNEENKNDSKIEKTIKWFRENGNDIAKMALGIGTLAMGVFLLLNGAGEGADIALDGAARFLGAFSTLFGVIVGERARDRFNKRQDKNESNTHP